MTSVHIFRTLIDFTNVFLYHYVLNMLIRLLNYNIKFEELVLAIRLATTVIFTKEVSEFKIMYLRKLLYFKLT